jgi:hypothetical protein
MASMRVASTLHKQTQLFEAPSRFMFGEESDCSLLNVARQSIEILIALCRIGLLGSSRKHIGAGSSGTSRLAPSSRCVSRTIWRENLAPIHRGH